MNSLIQKAIRKADEIRRHLSLDIYQPLDIYSACEKYAITTRFVDISMEGFYFKNAIGRAEIMLSSQRPLPRRKFTCAHEFGHHIFGHGSKVDALVESKGAESYYDEDEKLVDSFAAALLMPVAGIIFEFAKRNWHINTATPIQFFTVASVFGVGYRTLVTHCRINNLISQGTAHLLLKASPGRILESFLGKTIAKSYFLIIDGQSSIEKIDLEVSNYLIINKSVTIPDANHLQKITETPAGNIYTAISPGTDNFYQKGQAIAVNIQRQNYVGFSEYRHLEDLED